MFIFYSDETYVREDIWVGEAFCPACGAKNRLYLASEVSDIKLLCLIPILRFIQKRLLVTLSLALAMVAGLDLPSDGEVPAVMALVASAVAFALSLTLRSTACWAARSRRATGLFARSAHVDCACVSCVRIISRKVRGRYA